MSESSSSSLLRLQEFLPQLFQSQHLPGKPYLRFQLTSQITALFSMDKVKESLLVKAEQITPLPNLPASVMGIMSSRNHVFCVVDLAQFLMLPSIVTSSQRYHIIVVGTPQAPPALESELLLGVAVERIEGITRLTSDKLKSPLEDFPPSLTPYLQGCIENEKTIVLDVPSLVDATYSLAQFCL